MQHPHIITTAAELAALFDPVSEASLRKQVPYLHPTYQAMVAASPFVILATVGVAGLDASPRGDAPGFVVVRDERTLLLPERRGSLSSASSPALLATSISRVTIAMDFPFPETAPRPSVP